MKYLVVIERDRKGCSAYVPDLPGCIAAGKTVAQTKRLMREAIRLHLEDLRQRGENVPKPQASADLVAVA